MLNHLKKYVQSLRAHVDLETVEEDLRLLRQELSEHTLKPYQTAKEYFISNPFQSRVIRDFNHAYLREVNSNRRNTFPTFIESIHYSTETAITLLDKIDRNLERYFSKTISAEGLSYRAINALRLIELISFNTRYARQLLSWVYYEELKATNSTFKTEPLTRAQQKALIEQRTGFFKSVTILNYGEKDIMKMLENIPKLTFEPNEVDTVEQTMGSHKLDPLRTNLLPLVLNPIYHVRMAIAEWQVTRHLAAEEEKRALEYRLLLLKEHREGRKDIKLEKQIEYTENEIKKLNHRLSKMQES